MDEGDATTARFRHATRQQGCEKTASHELCQWWMREHGGESKKEDMSTGKIGKGSYEYTVESGE